MTIEETSNLPSRKKRHCCLLVVILLLGGIVGISIWQVTTTTTTGLPQRDLQEQEMVEHVMSMDAHDIADAFHDPMMMALGSMIVMAGAYMAIVMQETAAANAFALAAAGGKKKKK